MPAKARTTAAFAPSPRHRVGRGWVLALCLLWCGGATAAGAAATVTLVAGESDPQALLQPDGHNGPPSQSQRAIQALTKAMSVVSGKPMRKKSLKRYWPGPRIRRLPW